MVRDVMLVHQARKEFVARRRAGRAGGVPRLGRRRLDDRRPRSRWTAAGPSTDRTKRAAMKPTPRIRPVEAARRRRPTPRRLGSAAAPPPRMPSAPRALPGQVVLVLQGGGALGAYQVGVYQALHEAGIEPDWVIGTSIGAINARADRAATRRSTARAAATRSGARSSSRRRRRSVRLVRPRQRCSATLTTVMRGIPAFFTPNLARAARRQRAASASSRRPTTAPRRCARRSASWSTSTTSCDARTRLTVGAVNVCTGADALLRQPRGSRSASTT